MASKRTAPEQRGIGFCIESIPPSVNHYVKHTRSGRHIVSNEAKWFKDGLALVVNHRFVLGKAFYVSLVVVLGKGDHGDVDNFPKLVLDGLSAAGAFRNAKGEYLSDAYVEELLIRVDRKTRPEQGKTIIQVSALR
jgi:crossover junction endodeoxyribonuclease RusA